MPKYDMLQPYRMPDDAHKEMPRRNLVIAFHKEFTSLWIKTIQSNNEFDSVSEWIEYWFQVRKCMYECLDKIGAYMYKALAGKRTGSTGTEFDKTRKKMDRMLCSTLSYPKEHRPFEEEVEVPKKFLEVKQAYFNSMQNFLRQVAGLIQRDENDVRLALYNLKQAKAGLPKMDEILEQYKEYIDCKNIVEYINLFNTRLELLRQMKADRKKLNDVVHSVFDYVQNSNIPKLNRCVFEATTARIIWASALNPTYILEALSRDVDLLSKLPIATISLLWQ